MKSWYRACLLYFCAICSSKTNVHHSCCQHTLKYHSNTHSNVDCPQRRIPHVQFLSYICSCARQRASTSHSYTQQVHATTYTLLRTAQHQRTRCAPTHMGLSSLHHAPRLGFGRRGVLRITNDSPRDPSRRSVVGQRSTHLEAPLSARIKRTVTLKVDHTPPSSEPCTLQTADTLPTDSLPTVAEGNSNTATHTREKSWLDAIPLSPRVRGLVMLNCLVFLMATNWTVVKVGGGDLDPFSFAFFRFGVAALALAPFLKEAFREDRKELRGAGLELGLWTAAGYLTQSLGLLYTDASRASFLSTFTVCHIACGGMC